MSGGVDSSTTAYMLKEEGHEVFGMTMYLFDVPSESGELAAPSFLEDARRVAKELNIQHEVIDLRAIFKAEIIEPFINGYKGGKTPNPCAVCNAKIKYGLFMEEALKRGADYLATGHYVRLIRHADGLIHLHEGNTFRKDQSYFLHGLSQLKLEKLMLPLGEFENKQVVRDKASTYKTSVAAKKDSLGICFTQGKPPETYLREVLGNGFGIGNVMDLQGNCVGTHTGYYKFTIGQKKGFELNEAFKDSHRKMAIKAIDPESGNIIIAPEESLYSKTLFMEQMNWIFKPPAFPWDGEFKIFAWGYRLKGTINEIATGGYRVDFDNSVRAIAIGQACVAYLGDEVIGGGIITSFND